MRILCSSLVAVSVLAAAGTETDSFAFFQPTVVLNPADRATLARGVPLVRFLPATGHEIGAFTSPSARRSPSIGRRRGCVRRNC